MISLIVTIVTNHCDKILMTEVSFLDFFNVTYYLINCAPYRTTSFFLLSKYGWPSEISTTWTPFGKCAAVILIPFFLLILIFDQDLSRGLVTFNCYLWRVSLGSTLQRTLASDFSSPSPQCMKIAQKSPFTTLRANRANLFQFSCTILKAAGNLIIIGRKLKYYKKTRLKRL